MVLVWYALMLALLGCFMQGYDWFQARKKRMADCSHRWEYRSVSGAGYRWTRACIDCPFQQPCEPEQVPEAERKRQQGK
jgi:hypothetical protein